jgi:hypothetical protein
VGDKNLNALIPDQLHKKLKVQLAKDDMTYKDWLIKNIKDYVEQD